MLLQIVKNPPPLHPLPPGDGNMTFNETIKIDASLRFFTVPPGLTIPAILDSPRFIISFLGV